jgi:hypothetical protein
VCKDPLDFYFFFPGTYPKKKHKNYNRAYRQKDVKVKRVVNNKVKEGDKSKLNQG